MLPHTEDLKEEDVRKWIFHNCEGRTNKGHGCDWMLGGLFSIHRVTVVQEDGARIAVFEFADPQANDELKEKMYEVEEVKDWHGTLWLVEKDMPSKDSNDKKTGPVIKRGEILEFRYHYGVNFRRAKNGKFYYQNEGIFLKHCTLFGKIWDKIRSRNTATTKEILRLELYDLKLDMTNRCPRCFLKKDPKKDEEFYRYCTGCRKEIG